MVMGVKRILRMKKGIFGESGEELLFDIWDEHTQVSVKCTKINGFLSQGNRVSRKTNKHVAMHIETSRCS